MQQRTIALSALLLAGFLDLLGVTIVTVALPTITEDLAAGASETQAVLAAYTLTFAVGLITGARLGRRLGVRRAFLIGCVGFTLASLACALATGTSLLVGARIVQGAFAALMIPQVLATIQLMYEPAERAKPMAAFSALLGIAASAGPVLGGLIIGLDLFGSSWRGVFMINVPLGALILVLALRTLPATPPERVQLDLPGLLLSAVSLFMVIYGLSTMAESGQAVSGLVTAAAGAALFMAFIAHQRFAERRGGQPLVPGALRRRGVFRASMAVQILFFVPVMGFSLVVTQYVQSSLGYSALLAGVVVIPWAIFTGIGAGFGTTVLLPRIGRTVVQAGLVVMSAGMALVIVAVVGTAGDPAFWQLLPGSAVGGLGMGLVVGPLTEMSVSQVTREHASDASGLFYSVGQLSASLGFATVGSAYFVLSTASTSQAYAEALAVALTVGIAVAVLAAAVAFTLPRRYLAESGAAEAEARTS
ncbi:MFS transporter [Pseudonocardia sp. ICBG1142]|uniref:MFS transporter n=1 Tax=Pseudonocardia sp. ICBG1142 TaxID=2846760 RepID=UPI001CF6E62E|nr:MFS transporter [Pseudonocardia sp. ICBG1142]